MSENVKTKNKGRARARRPDGDDQFDTPNGYGSSSGGYNPQDWGRKRLSHGGCVYIDTDHLELCVPETPDAFEHTAAGPETDTTRSTTP